jgi:phosphoserine phosphatase RsbU/P
MDLRERFDTLASRFGRGPSGAPPGAGEDYWRHVQDLFTRDVTRRSFRELVEQDTQDTFRFFTREVDFGTLARRPWYQRWPLGAWRVFLAIAFRLSPARRVAFAVAVPILAFALGASLLHRVLGASWEVPSLFDWLLFAAVALFLLLVLELRDKLALKGDLEIARQIQFGLLPFEPVARGDFSVHASMRPANTVGGDYFDVIDVAPGTMGVVIGDVAGKGIPAALLMALLQGSLRTLITAGLRGEAVVAALNRHLHAHIPSNRLVTLVYAEVELATGTVRYVNAGHNPPLLVRGDGRTERLMPNGMALGILAESPYEAVPVTLERGERLLLYTDGITEASNARDEEWGEDRLRATLSASAALDGPALLERVRGEVLGFCDLVRPRDDMTLLLLSRAAGRA